MNNNKVITFTLVVEDLSDKQINMIESNHIEDIVTLLRFSEEEQTVTFKGESLTGISIENFH
ncbi:hypothetical protein [Macrococcus armenti]|uniref:hypothetical protein n=1 Tax=Macrococcus armenti TaxID=2875764 RepID=UPI001CCADFD9|nr:hypothetical protein [Macrococcus armenti]UBH12227.1 hypothetical protein LAU43_06470 [Macrococcus armenti]UBH14416.1 hypothetical protein LAU44_06400 [Macrococcus armenti]UBH16776.1 hypothetical protein LAU39_06415 [Macrococcus armenti]UBH19039.1 hypothetical protein LAU40_06405 [Macrococcus armenti]